MEQEVRRRAEAQPREKQGTENSNKRKCKAGYRTKNKMENKKIKEQKGN